MPKAKLPPATDWQARDIADWNTATFRKYLEDQHAERFGIPYVARNYGAEAGMLKRMVTEHGQAATKAFIDACMADYKPSRQYPSLNFGFMYGFMRARILPMILADMKRAEIVAAKAGATSANNNEVEPEEWW